MKIFIAVVILLISCQIAYAKMPRALVDKDTNQILSWGYTDFKELNGTEIAEDVYLKQGENVEEGLRYEGGKVIKDPTLAFEVKTEKEIMLETLTLTEEDITKIKALPTEITP